MLPIPAAVGDVRAGVVSAIMYLVLVQITAGRRMTTVSIRVAVGIALYFGIMALIDADLRAMARKLLARFSKSKAPG